MAERFYLYLSISPDLRAERETLFQMIAHLPINVGFVIKTTPGGNEIPALDVLQRANSHIFILGGDIQAPMGIEWQVARGIGKQHNRSQLFVKDIGHTLAAQAFLHHVEETWIHYKEPSELQNIIQPQIVEQVLDGQNRFGLTVAEIERLRDLQEKLKNSSPTPAEAISGKLSAGGVIFAPGRDEPTGGVLVNKTSKQAGKR
ncbi:MAG: hypothetical protein EXR62_12960 [Chloroflexi bacterium]|nr:hypothetical protein [Chloroflexota bacterium]